MILTLKSIYLGSFVPQRQCEVDPDEGQGGAGPQGHLPGGLLDLPKLHLQLPWQCGC